MRAVIALGGNAILGKEDTGAAAEQQDAIEDTVSTLQDTLSADDEIVFTHGNGPQVGNLLLQQEGNDAAMPLDVLVAETQAQIGYLLQQALDNAFDWEQDVLTVVTQVVVDADDAAFDEPTKPVGPYYTKAEAEQKAFPTMRVDDSERGFRRIVPSPMPQDIVEGDEVRTLVEQGSHVVCGGGGGVPVVRDDGLQGVEAVIDKDKTAALLADEVGADTLIILTDVPCAYRGYGTDEQEPICEADVDEMQRLLDQDAFGTGSMRPKVEACISFISRGGARAIITDPGHLADAMRGEAGTRVT